MSLDRKVSMRSLIEKEDAARLDETPQLGKQARARLRQKMFIHGAENDGVEEAETGRQFQRGG